MMNLRFVSQDLQWSDTMKAFVQAKIVQPLQRHLNTDNFELSVHLGVERKRIQNGARKPRFEMWVVLQTFDGRGNEVVRGQGADFLALTNEVSSNMRTRIRKSHARRRFTINPFRFSALERTV